MAKPQKVDIDSLLDESSKQLPKGTDIASVGPSDSSDTGADMAGVGGTGSTSDRHRTGERASVEKDAESEAEADIAPDEAVAADEAGLGSGLDEAEEARLGVTDEQIERGARKRSRR